jgi:hypothetical protein
MGGASTLLVGRRGQVFRVHERSGNPVAAVGPRGQVEQPAALAAEGLPRGRDGPATTVDAQPGLVHGHIVG